MLNAQPPEGGIFSGQVAFNPLAQVGPWVVGDNIRRGQALNCVAIAEILVPDYL